MSRLQHDNYNICFNLLTEQPKNSSKKWFMLWKPENFWLSHDIAYSHMQQQNNYFNVNCFVPKSYTLQQIPPSGQFVIHGFEFRWMGNALVVYYGLP